MNGIAIFLPCSQLEINYLNLGHNIKEVLFKKFWHLCVIEFCFVWLKAVVCCPTHTHILQIGLCEDVWKLLLLYLYISSVCIKKWALTGCSHMRVEEWFLSLCTGWLLWHFRNLSMSDVSCRLLCQLPILHKMMVTYSFNKVWTWFDLFCHCRSLYMI
jgi:hypothetical protein